MSDAIDLHFDEFPAATKSEWLTKLERDLRGRPMADLQWQLGEDIEMAPFYHPEDVENWSKSIPNATATGMWEIGEDFKVRSATQANAQLVDALENGITAPHFWPAKKKPFGRQALRNLLKGVDPTMVSLHFSGEFSIAQAIKFINHIRQVVSSSKCAGTLHIENIYDFSGEGLKMLMETVHTLLPKFRIVGINGKPSCQGPEHVVEELHQIISAAQQQLENLQNAGADMDQIGRQFHFQMAVGKSYFVEVAKLRALRLLWGNVLRAYGCEVVPPFLDVHFAPNSYGEDANFNMIRATTLAMSAVLGGADRLTVLPANSLRKKNDPFTRRIARNVQHLLQLESYFGKVSDPAAGSYYIEKLTTQLAERAWEKFGKSEG